MLTIKRHFPINKLSVSKAMYATKEFFGKTRAAVAGGFTSLRARNRSMGKKSILSSMILLVGFFGTLSALLVLYPLATDNGSTKPVSPTNANIETEKKTAAPSATDTPAASTQTSDTGAATRNSVNDSGTPPIATSPASPAPAVSPAPVAQPAAPQPSVTTQPTITSAPAPAVPSTPVPAPVTAPAPVTTDPTSVLPMLTAPVTDTVEGTTDTLQDTTNNLLD